MPPTVTAVVDVDKHGHYRDIIGVFATEAMAKEWIAVHVLPEFVTDCWIVSDLKVMT